MMPVDLEMLLSAGPPLYAYSAFVDSRYTRVTSDNFVSNESYRNDYTVSKRSFFNSHHLQSDLEYSGIDSPFENHETNNTKEATAKERSKSSCLQQDCASKQAQNKSREKKKVSFADDKGLALVEVRSIPVTQSFALKWPKDFLSVFTCGITEKSSCEKKWKIAFPNPTCSSSALAMKLKTDLVALEKLVVEEGEEDLIRGSIKVRNTAYEKEVFFRVTFDRWSSYEDVPAIYDSYPGNSGDLSRSKAYDTFMFSTLIPPQALRYEVVEFCVCYRANGQEHWDNNGGVNYRLVSTAVGKTYKTSREVSEILSNNHKRDNQLYTPVTDSYSSCTEMEAWKTWLNNQPYW